MRIATTVTLAEDDTFTMSPAEAAQAVLDAFGGDSSVDTCTVQVTMPVGVVQPPLPDPMPQL